MKGDTLYTLIQKSGYVPQETLEEALAYSKEHGVSVSEYLIEQRVLTKDMVGQIIAHSFGVPYADLNSNQASQAQKEKLSAQIAKKHRVIFFREDDGGVIITTDKPDQKNLKTLLKKELKAKNVTINYSLTEDIDIALLQYRSDLKKRVASIINSKDNVAPKLVQEIILEALASQSSDIHIEPHTDHVIVRYRIDGLLQELVSLPEELHHNLVNWFKVKAQLRIDEHFAPQDGSVRMVIDSKEIDMRISIVPTLEGEKIAIRVLSQYAQNYTFADMGLSADQKVIIENAIHKPFGMIIVSGPTGSGKTTTLYTFLKTVAKSSINVTTIEDPVEYKIHSANQIQVNEKSGLTFAKGLRSIVRQDPDVILVGEIRDTETAEIAVNAALTGHMLLSTFHANDAGTTIPRLMDMDIEPFLLSSTLELIISQRLTRKICDNCKTSIVMTEKQLSELLHDHKKFFPNKNTTLFAGKGCDACNHTGYKGRVAIYELLKLTPELKELINSEPSKEEILKLAKQQGFEPMFIDGINKVKAGVTTVSEVLRVASQD